jgi:hypothetical protein
MTGTTATAERLLDEFQNFITPDIAKILDQCRKRGLYIIFAHQHMSQIYEQDPWTYHSVLANARVKFVFSLDDPRDLELMEEHLFMGEHDLKLIKHQSYSGQEAATPTYWSLPELRYQNQAEIAGQPRQHMMLKVEDQPHRVVKVATVENYSRDEVKLQEVRRIILSANPKYYMTEDAVFSECDGATFGSWSVPGTSLGPFRYHQDPGQIDRLWILDVDGTLTVIDIAYYEGTPQSVIHELEAIVDSVSFD